MAIIRGFYNNTRYLSQIEDSQNFCISLDVSPVIDKYIDSTSNAIAALALFHYTNKYEHPDWTSDHAIVATLLDLFGENVPAHLYSADARHRMITTAKLYIRSMDTFQPHWSNVTSKDYRANLAEYPYWPTIEDPSVDTAGNDVEDGDLFEAFAYCFEKPLDKVVLRIRSGLWAIVIAAATNGRITDEMLSRTTSDLSALLKHRLVIPMHLIDFIVEHLYFYTFDAEKISAGNLLNNLTSHSCEQVASRKHRVRSVIERATWASLPELRTIIKAFERFPDFDWATVYSKEGAALVNDIKNLKSFEGFLRNRDDMDASRYGSFAYVARDLFIRFNYMKSSDFDDWFALTLCSRDVVECIERYVFLKNNGHSDGHKMPESILEVLKDLRV